MQYFLQNFCTLNCKFCKFGVNFIKNELPYYHLFMLAKRFMSRKAQFMRTAQFMSRKAQFMPVRAIHYIARDTAAL